MKKILIIGLLTLFIASCTMITYTSNELSSKYKLEMSNKNEKVLFDKIPVYLSETEIPGQFTVLSLNTYNPIVLPVIGNRKKAILEKLYKNAVVATEELNGNGVLIIDDSHFKVLSITFDESYLKKIADENSRKIAYADSIRNSVEKLKSIKLKEKLSQDSIRRVVVTKEKPSQDSIKKALPVQQIDELSIHFNIGDKVTFLEKIDIKGQSKTVQITNGTVVDVKDVNVKISFKYNGKVLETIKRKSEVKLSTL